MMPAPKLRKGGRALLMKALREIKKHPKSFHEWLKTGL